MFMDILKIKEIIQDRNMWRDFFAEFLGTLLLVFIGCGSCINLGEPPTIVQIAFTFGLIVGTIMQAIGGHQNPAVTLAFMFTHKIKPIRGTFLIIFQFAGAIAGSAILQGLLPEEILLQNNLGMTLPHECIGAFQAFGIEFIGTFILVITIFGNTDENRNDLKGSAPLAIGLSVTACNLIAIKFTGAGMNPARSFGPGIISNIWRDHWVYWVAPCLGGIFAGLLYQIVFKPSDILKPDSDAQIELFKIKNQKLNNVDPIKINL